MPFKHLIVFLVIIMSSIISIPKAYAEETVEERLARLEKLVQEQAQLIEELQAKIDQTGQAAPLDQGADTSKIHTRDLVDQIGNLQFSFSTTGVLQSVINGKNAGLLHDLDKDGEWDDSSDKTDASGSLNFEIQSTIGDDGLAYARFEAGSGAGLDPDLPTFAILNSDADDNNNLRLTEAYYKRKCDEHLTDVRIGRLDPTMVFDLNEYANDETAQFLSYSLVNSSSVIWPDDYAVGTDVTWQAGKSTALALGVYDADGDLEAVTRDLFVIGQMSLNAKINKYPGNYRFYGWMNKNRNLEDLISENRERSWGAGVSFDQQVCPNMGLFARYGISDKDVYPIAKSWSVGANIFGSKWHRDDDLMGFALGQAVPSKKWVESLGEDFNSANELLLELFYRYKINDQLAITPDLQVIWNASGNGDNDAVFILGTRVQMDF